MFLVTSLQRIASFVVQVLTQMVLVIVVGGSFSWTFDWVAWFVRAYFARYSEVTLCLKARCIFDQGLLQVLNLTFKGSDVLQVLVWLSHFGTELIVYLLFLLMQNVWVLLVKKDSRLLRCQVRCRSLSPFFSCNKPLFFLLTNAFAGIQGWSICQTLITTYSIVAFELFYFILLSDKLAFQSLSLLAHLDDF